MAFDNAGNLNILFDSNPAGVSYITVGNVGIGTNSPKARLHVVQLSNTNAFRVDDGPGDTPPFVIDKNGRIRLCPTCNAKGRFLQKIRIHF